MREKSQKIRDTNKELAISNLELEPKLSELKTQLLERTSELTALKEEYDKKILELSKRPVLLVECHIMIVTFSIYGLISARVIDV